MHFRVWPLRHASQQSSLNVVHRVGWRHVRATVGASGHTNGVVTYFSVRDVVACLERDKSGHGGGFGDMMGCGWC